MTAVQRGSAPMDPSTPIIDGLQVSALVQIPEVQPAAVLGTKQHLGHQARACQIRKSGPGAEISVRKPGGRGASSRYSSDRVSHLGCAVLDNLPSVTP
jgi:hypothetical protein